MCVDCGPAFYTEPDPPPQPCCNSPEPENHYHGWYEKSTELLKPKPAFGQRVVDTAKLIYENAPWSSPPFRWAEALRAAALVVGVEDQLLDIVDFDGGAK